LPFGFSWVIDSEILRRKTVRLASGWWRVLICFERKVLLADCWWLVWLVCSERKVLLAGG
jgi:hypothetical protein